MTTYPTFEAFKEVLRSYDPEIRTIYLSALDWAHKYTVDVEELRHVKIKKAHISLDFKRTLWIEFSEPIESGVITGMIWQPVLSISAMLCYFPSLEYTRMGVQHTPDPTWLLELLDTSGHHQMTFPYDMEKKEWTPPYAGPAARCIHSSLQICEQCNERDTSIFRMWRNRFRQALIHIEKKN